MDALKFEYPNYPKISKEADTGVKKKRNVSILKIQAIRFVNENKKSLLKPKDIRSVIEAKLDRKPAIHSVG
jgi:hypothetical protein